MWQHYKLNLILSLLKFEVELLFAIIFFVLLSIVLPHEIDVFKFSLFFGKYKGNLFDNNTVRCLTI